MSIIDRIIDIFKKPYFEPEHDENVEHDTVMQLVNGELVEVTIDDSEVQKQE